MKLPLIALAAGAMLLVSSPATAQDEWTRQVRSQLRAAGERFEQDGYELTHDISTGSLNQGASYRVTMDLSIGTEYFIMGVCDEDCSDLDLVLYDRAGNIVDSDMAMDDYPIVNVVPSRSGTYTVEVRMATCSIAPCRYGVGVFGR